MNYLHFYRCSLCRSTLQTSYKGEDRHECIVCGRFMRYEGSQPVTTAAEQAIYDQGVVYNGGPQTTPVHPWTCVRCGRESAEDRPKYRPDGRCCRACVAAEASPSLATAEQVRLARIRRDLIAQEDEDRQEAAYRRAEEIRR